jgi:hypothetical protein
MGAIMMDIGDRQLSEGRVERGATELSRETLKVLYIEYLYFYKSEVYLQLLSI